jgi:hypothetical protein
MALDIGSACAGHMTKGILRSMRYPYPDFDRRERVVIAVRNVPGDNDYRSRYRIEIKDKRFAVAIQRDDTVGHA